MNQMLQLLLCRGASRVVGRAVADACSGNRAMLPSLDAQGMILRLALLLSQRPK